MGWFAFLIPLLEDFLKECMENRDPAKVEAGLLDPGAAEKYGMAVVMRRQGWRGKKLRRRLRKGMAELRKADPADISAMVAQVAKRVA